MKGDLLLETPLITIRDGGAARLVLRASSGAAASVARRHVFVTTLAALPVEATAGQTLDLGDWGLHLAADLVR